MTRYRSVTLTDGPTVVETKGRTKLQQRYISVKWDCLIFSERRRQCRTRNMLSPFRLSVTLVDQFKNVEVNIMQVSHRTEAPSVWSMRDG